MNHPTVNNGCLCVDPFLRRLADGLSPTGSIRRCISRYSIQILMTFIQNKIQQTLIHGCCNNSAALILLLGSRSSIDVNASRHSIDIFGNRPKSMVLLITLAIISSSLSLKDFRNKKLFFWNRFRILPIKRCHTTE